MSSRIFETRWKKALTSILEELTKSEFRKLMFTLDEIPQGRKAAKYREELPDIIIQYYGPEESISVMDKQMKVLPRNDAKVQEPLQHFVEELKEREKTKEAEKKTATESRSVDKKTKPAAGEKRKREEDDEEDEGDGVSTDQQKSGQPDNKRNAPWQKSIRDLKSSTILETEGFVGKVVQKSRLHPYQTKDKAKKGFFYLAVADKTASVKMKVYGKDHFKKIKEGSSYLFSRSLIKEKDVIVVNTKSNASQINDVDVPEELEKEATRLIYPECPVYSIHDAKLSADETKVSVEGTVTQIDPVGKTKVKYQRPKVKTQRFHLEDETDSIWIDMWNEGVVGECRGLSVGDVVKLNNMKTHKYYEDVSLNSTASTRIIKVQSVGVQKERIKIVAIKKATMKETQLEAEKQEQLHTFVVATLLLAKTVGVKLTGDYRESLLDKLPFSADAEIQGNNKIIKMTAASKM